MGPSYKSKINQKRGLGEKENYIPWIKVGEFSNIGHSSRVKGLKTNREHHLHSNLESRLFYALDLNPSISDIREQFPLLDLNLIEEITKKTGIRYPSFKKEEPHVLTTDFFIDYVDNRQLALTVKPLGDITKRQLELFEIERRYWKANDINWKLATAEELPSRDYALNCKDLHNSLRGFLEDSYDDQLLERIKTSILDLYPELPQTSIPNFSTHIDNDLGIESGTALRFLKSLIAKGLVSVDLNVPLTKGRIKTQNLTLNFTHATSIGKSDLAA